MAAAPAASCPNPKMAECSGGPPTELRLGLEWEVWAVTELLEGTPSREVIDAITDAGVPREHAAELVRRIRRSRPFRTKNRRFARALMAERLIEARRRTRGPIAVDRRRAIDRDTLHRDYWTRARPLHLTEAAKSMGAVERWSIEGFAQRFGDLEVEVNTDRERAQRRALTESVHRTMTFGEFLRGLGEHTNDRYIVSRNGLFSRPELRELWADLDPLPPFLERPEPPRGASLWVGPGGTMSPLHFDPHHVLLVQVVGRKRVWLVPPDSRTIFEGLDGYYAESDAREHPGALEVLLDPGEALFIPVAFFHQVEALEPSMTLSLLSFPWENDFHWLRPVSSVSVSRRR